MKDNRDGRRMNSENKPKNTKMVLIRLSVYLKAVKWQLVLAIILTVTSNVLALIGPALSGYAIDAIEPGKGAVLFERYSIMPNGWFYFMCYPLFYLMYSRY